MSILWCGGEEIDFDTSFASIVVDTQTHYRRTSFTRSSCRVGSGADGRSNPFTGVTSAWLSFIFASYSTSTKYQPCGLGNTAYGRRGIYVGGDDSVTNKLALYKYDGTTLTKLATETGASFSISQSPKKFDMHITDYGVSSNVKVYYEGTELIDFTGDTSISGITELNCVVLSFGGTYCYVSEFIVADEDTRLMSLKTLAPDAAGDASDWTNSYTSIDEVALSDADTIYTDTADDEFQCNLQGMPTGDFICKGVKMVARATDGVGGLGVQMGIKTNSTVDLGSSITLGGSWETIEELYQQNPVTSNRFTPAEIEALQFAVKSVTV